MKNKEIVEKPDVDVRMVSKWVSWYRNGGISSLDKPVGGRHHQNMTLEEEKEFLKQ